MIAGHYELSQPSAPDEMDAITDQQARDVLAEAGAWLSEHEWCQGVMAVSRVGFAEPRFDDDIALCALGAIEASNRHAGYELDAMFAAVGRLARDVHATYTGGDLVGPAGGPATCGTCADVITTWNDDPARSKEDVVLALKQAAHDA